ncbi:helix-turn-helix transcriptional regulator [Mucilaginibacter sp. BJC16-A38]|uniref:winged helix-turn-helix transcriptional regulator n=1 Tax=Mucilaginibacter phenanthrenivorans TaxID=1234842 RepID=UPI00215729B2|nr:helix-turn-helix domain-containing protein [Mucilaginibacter phenanthrenivorans]MCR8556742.1 helix-turn-helix transcriptional regulator [Mucilaginibacter phenanthrenivorans]
MLEKEIIEKKYQQACDCPITSAVNVIGGKWKPIIIWILMTESRRFGEIHKSIPGIALKVLSRHLKELEADGIITRKAYPEVPPRVEYTLTEKGRALNGIMDLLVVWSREYVMEAV